jgi:histidinol-phosphate/aromatic aminotransferase/cobyric acid decarboxylase-like protein
LHHDARPLVDFSVCLNAHGPAPIVRAAIAQCPVDEYPDPTSFQARATIATHCHRPIDELILGAGSAELIQAVCLAYLERGDAVLIATPCFGEYARAARLCGAHVRSTATIDELIAHIGDAPKLVFLASPSSPIGGQESLDTLRRIADACLTVDALLVLDQAYDAFTLTPHGTPALAGHSHVLHLRSLTKDHALANVRVAFGVGAPDVIRALEAVRIPWAASGAAQAAAMAALSDTAQAHARATTSMLRAEAVRMSAAIAAIGFPVIASDTHYFLVKCHDAAQTRAWMLDHASLLVRDGTSFGLPTHVRVAARLAQDNDRLIAAFAQFRSTFSRSTHDAS